MEATMELMLYGGALVKMQSMIELILSVAALGGALAFGCWAWALAGAKTRP
jgi:hypothetical protein